MLLRSKIYLATGACPKCFAIPVAQKFETFPGILQAVFQAGPASLTFGTPATLLHQELQCMNFDEG